MATLGILNDGVVNVYGEYSYNQPANQNYTTLYTNIILYCNGYGGGYEGFTGGVQIGGGFYSGSGKSINTGVVGTYILYSRSDNIQHNSDGSFPKGMGLQFNCGYAGGTRYSDHIYLDTIIPTIPRVSNISISPFIIGENASIIIGRASSNFTDTIDYEFGSLKGNIATKTSQSTIVYKFPDAFYEQMPNSSTKKGKVICKTYNGDNLIGTSESEFTATATGNPVIESIKIVDSNSKTKALTGDENKFIKGFSNAKITVIGKAINSASLSTVKTQNGDKSINTLIGTINTVESGLFTTVLTDSRGYSNDKNANISGITNKELIDYIPSSFINTDCSITRVNQLSNTAKVNLKGNYWSKNFGKVNNTLEIKIRAKESGTSNWIYSFSIPNEKVIYDNPNNKFSVVDYIIGSDETDYFDSLKQWDFEFYLIDKLIGQNETTIEKPLSKGIPHHYYFEEGSNFNNQLLNNGIQVSLIEKGLNVNGNYYKFNDGLLICEHEMTKSFNFNTNYGSVYWTNETTIWDFPYPFIETPNVSINVLSGSILGTNQTFRNNNLKADFFVFNYKQESIGSAKVKLMATGKWK